MALAILSHWDQWKNHSTSCLQGVCGCCAELLLPAITRVAGIIGGVLLSLMLSVLLWPKSASEQAMRYAPLAMDYVQSPSSLLFASPTSQQLFPCYFPTGLSTHDPNRPVAGCVRLSAWVGPFVWCKPPGSRSVFSNRLYKDSKLRTTSRTPCGR